HAAVSRERRRTVAASYRGGDGPRELNRADGGVIVGGPRLARPGTRTDDVLRWVGQVIREVAFSRNDRDAPAERVANRPTLGVPDCPLLGIVAAIEQPRVNKIAVVGHVDLVGGRPHERADNRLGEEKTGGVAGLDPSDLDVGRDPNDAKTVDGRCDGSSCMRAVSIIIIPGRGCGVRHPAQTGYAPGKVDVVDQVRMVDVESRVYVPNDHRWTATGDGLCLWDVDLHHIPLQPRESIPIEVCRRV